MSPVAKEYRQSDPLGERIVGMRTFSRSVQIALVVLALVVSAVLVAVSAFDLHAGLRLEADSYADLVLAARAWNAGHGGVYVLKSPEVASNTYLRDLGVEPDIVTDDGVELTLRNPALMTREISERLARSRGVQFRLTSLDPVNPLNSADEWERQALEGFVDDKTAASTVGEVEGTTYFRYVVPMVTEESCLTCHRRQGYRVGDVRGGLEILIPYASTRESLIRNAWILTGVGLAASAFLVVAFGAQFGRYQRGLEDAGTRLTKLATLDYLTGIPNRRTGIERLIGEIDRSRRLGEPLSVIALDIDHFKRINDESGHAAGDDVLRAVTERMAGVVRDYDTLARMGGEEFLVIAPNTDTQKGLGLAERLLDALRANVVPARERAYRVTMSAGVATLGDDDDADSLLDRADHALYSAKEAGRDRVISR